MSDQDKVTSTQAAQLFGVDRATTRKAAAYGHVQDAKQEARVGAINPPWVATREAWQHWFDNRRPAGRPAKRNEAGGDCSQEPSPPGNRLPSATEEDDDDETNGPGHR